MIDSAYIIYNKRGIVRMVKGARQRNGARQRPALKAGEHAVLVRVDAPNEIFEPQATLRIPSFTRAEPTVEIDDQEPLLPERTTW